MNGPSPTPKVNTITGNYDSYFNSALSYAGFSGSPSVIITSNVNLFYALCASSAFFNSGARVVGPESSAAVTELL